jgi:hypothetical protein
MPENHKTSPHTESTYPTQPVQPSRGRLYHILGVRSDASQDEIRQAYRQMALIHHPDKQVRTATHSETNDTSSRDARFKEILQAYKILSDEKTRDIYDRYDEPGIMLYEHVGDQAEYARLFFDPLYLCVACIVSSLLVLVVFLFPLFLALQLGIPLYWNWAIIAVPIWIIDTVIAVIILSLIWKGKRKDSMTTHREDISSSSQQQEVMSSLSWLEKSTMCVWFGSLVFFEILVVLRLNHQIGWSWIIIFIPYWVMEMILFCRNTRLAIDYMKLFSSMPLTLRLLLIYLEYQWWLYRVLFTIFLALQVQGVIYWNWALILLPLYAGVTIYVLVKPIAVKWKLPFLPSDEDRQQEIVLCISKAVLEGIVIVLFLAFVGMLVTRLNGTVYYQVATILIPIFILLGLIFCCCCCCIPSFVWSLQTLSDAELRQQMGTPDAYPMYSSNHQRMLTNGG